METGDEVDTVLSGGAMTYASLRHAASALRRITSPRNTLPPPLVHFIISRSALVISPALIFRRRVDIFSLPNPRLYAKSATPQSGFPRSRGHSASVPRAKRRASCCIRRSACSCVQARPGTIPQPVLPHPQVHIPAGHRYGMRWQPSNRRIRIYREVSCATRA